MTQNVFLTGATGAIGPILAAELLSSGAAEHLNVLIRPGDTPASTRFDRWIETLESVLASSGSLLARPRKRIAYTSGDLGAEDLAINDAQRSQLVNETDVIVSTTTWMRKTLTASF
jgi:thioester reductase-like protein